jgi:hypothetical protein
LIIRYGYKLEAGQPGFDSDQRKDIFSSSHCPERLWGQPSLISKDIEGYFLGVNPLGGGAVAQKISRWLPTAAARVRFREACGVYGGQSGTGAGFLRVLRFPLPIIPPISPLS